jgi:predicted molibdopterin-dependent oxidoreductase YjgC
MFKKQYESHESVSIIFEGNRLNVEKGLTVASALLVCGETVFRSSVVSGQPRAPYCMMGVCFECLIEIDGIPNQRACMIPVREAMKIKRQLKP